MGRRYLVIPFLVILLGLIVGCKHNISITPSNSGQQTRTSSHIGDRARYISTMSMQGVQGLHANGNRTYTIVATNNHGRTILSKIVNTFDLKEDITSRVGNRSKAHTVITWFGEDISGNLYRLGDSIDGKTWDMVKDADPQLYMPSKMQVGCWWRSTMNMESGNKQILTYRCLGIESIPTRLGPLKA